jgi:hypothetical protein
VVGIVWFLLWELDGDELGFFFDLPWGLFVGLVYGLVVLVVLAGLAGLIWTGVGMSQGGEGGFSGVMSSNMDRLALTSPVAWVNDNIDAWNRSGVVMGIGYAYKVAFTWGLAGGIVWGFGLNFAASLLIVILFGLGGALAVAHFHKVTDTLVDSLGDGYPWLDGVLSQSEERWASWGFGGFMAAGGAVSWAVVGLIASAGLGAGIVESIVLGLLAFIAAIGGAFLAARMKWGQEA